MDETAKIETPADSLPFLLGGKATFTLRSVATHRRFTYKIEGKAKGDKFYRVIVLTGIRYLYLGCIVGERYVPDQDYNICRGALSRKAFEWFYGRALKKMDLTKLELWHEGKCSKCGRGLTDPDSIKTGLGPVCRGKV